MLYLLLLVLISSYVTSEKTFVKVDPERLPFLLNIFKTCADKTGVDSNTMQELMQWKFDDNDSFKKYMFCFTQGAGYGDNNGHLVRDKIVKFIGNHKLRGEFIKAIDECNKLQGNNKYDTIFKTAICFRDTSPISFKL